MEPVTSRAETKVPQERIIGEVTALRKAVMESDFGVLWMGQVNFREICYSDCLH